jgi:hypothetical protein
MRFIEKEYKEKLQLILKQKEWESVKTNTDGLQV